MRRERVEVGQHYVSLCGMTASTSTRVGMSAPWPVQVIGAALMLTCADISPLALVAASPLCVPKT